MKIRSDFVTNSSSVSYILTMKEELANDMKDWFTMAGSENAIVYEKLKELIHQGEKIQVGSDVLYMTEVRFHTNDVISSEQKDFDFKHLSPDDLLLYIYGEYILNGKISTLGVFGATLTDHF